MSSRALLLLTVLLAASALPASAQPCPPAQDPCTILGGSTVAAGIYDIRPRSLLVTQGQVTVDTTGNLTIQAANIVFQPGARMIAPGLPDAKTGGTVIFEATGTIDLQSAGTSKSRIDVTGFFAGGQISLTADGNVTANAALVANGTSRDGGGGEIDITSIMGSLSVTGDGLTTLGGDRFGGGEVYLESTTSSLTLDAPVTAAKGDCSACEVDLTAGLDILTTVKGDIDGGASRAGDGGTIDIDAGNNVTLNGQLLANAAGTLEDGGGDGGDISATANNGFLVINDRIEANGASPDGGAGTIDFDAFTTITQVGPIFATAVGFGSDGSVSLDAGGNVSVKNIELSGAINASSLFLNSGGTLTVDGIIHGVLTNPALSPTQVGADCDIEGCQVVVTSGANITCQGPDIGQNIFIAGSTAVQIAGHLTATVGNRIEWRSTQPNLTGSVIVPPPVIAQNLLLPCCGVNCTTTTTTTTTTSTTTTSTTSTTTTTTTLASTTSTTLPGTTSTTITIPTTSTTSTTKTTTTTIATTTSTTSTTKTTTTTIATTTTTTSTSTSSTATTSSTTASTTSSTSTTSGSSSSTTSSTQSSSTTSTTAVTTTSTSAPTTSSTSVTSTTTTTTASPTTSTTEPATSCLDTETGIGAVRCRLDILSNEVTAASTTALGGKQPKKKLAGKLARATRQASTDPTTTKRLKHVAQQLKSFIAQVNRGLASGKVDSTIGNGLATLAAEAQAEVAGLLAP